MSNDDGPNRERGAELTPGTVESLLLFKPVVDLETGAVVACETVGPAAGASGGEVIAVLQATGRAGFTNPSSVFGTANTTTVQSLADSVPLLPPVMLVSEDTLLEDPGRLVRAVRALHEAGARVGMRDVGTHPTSLALLPLLQPDVVVVDIQVLVRQPDWQRAQTLNAITAYAEETDAIVIADGITNPTDSVRARSFGAAYGQGPFYGPPTGAFADAVHLLGIKPGRRVVHGPAVDTPYSVATKYRVPKPSTKTLLMHTTRFLETCAFDCDEATFVFSCMQENTNLTKNTADLYAALSRNLSLVVTFVKPVRTATDTLGRIDDLRVRYLDDTDPLANEWVILILNAKYSVLLAATETGTSPEGEDTFDFILTHDRAIVTEAAHALTSRL